MLFFVCKHKARRTRREISESPRSRAKAKSDWADSLMQASEASRNRGRCARKRKDTQKRVFLFQLSLPLRASEVAFGSEVTA